MFGFRWSPEVLNEHGERTMTEIIMDILLKLLEASVLALLGYVAWKQRETSRNNETRRETEKAELEARRAREKAELEQRLKDAEAKSQERLEQVESQQIRIQSEADSLRATHDHHAELIRHLGRTEETRNQETARWRVLLDDIRISRLEGEKLIAGAIENSTQATLNQNSLIEIQTAAFGNLKTVVETSLQTIGTKVDTSSNELRLIKTAVDILTSRLNAMIEGQDANTLSNEQRHNSIKSDTQNTVTELSAIKTIAETIASGMNTILQRMENTQSLPVTPVTTGNTDTEPKADNEAA